MKGLKCVSLLSVATLTTMFTIFPARLNVCAESNSLTEEEAIQQGGQIVLFDEEYDDALGDDALLFRPVDCGVQAQDIYEYPFLGLTVTLTQNMLDKIDRRDAYLSLRDDYADEVTVRYAMIRFFAPNQAQKEQEGMSVDILAWEDELEKVGVLGVYQKEQVDALDALTGCDVHTLLGSSADGAYEYYLSVNSSGDYALVQELEASDIVVGEMRPLDATYSYNAFSVGRIDDVSSVGLFSTEDVFGASCTQEIFQSYELTLVNVFPTWCTSCVEETPTLEKLRQSFEEKGIRLGVVGVVTDTKTAFGVDEIAVEAAQRLHERSGAQFPFLVPDDGEMNGRLTGLESYPESFFVDQNGNIVSEPYLGARSLEEWTQIVEQELTKIER